MGGVNDLKSHRWFSSNGFDWELLEERRMHTPYIPPLKEPLDTSHFDDYPEDDYVPRYTGPQHVFEGF